MRLEQLTFLRFVAAFALVIYHYGTKVFPFNQGLLKGFFNHANLGVSFFFVLSGYVLMLAYGKDKSLSKLHFFKKRFTRIYPVYLLGILLMTLYYFAYNYFGNGSGFQIGHLISNVFLLQAWIPNHALTVNFVGWTLSVEVFFYLLFPFILKWFNRSTLRNISIVVFVIWGLSQWAFWELKLSPFYQGYPSDSHNFVFYFPVFHLSQFLIGALAGYYYVNVQSKVKMNIVGGLLTIVILVPYLYVGVIFGSHNGLLAIPFAILLLLFSTKSNIYINWFSKPFFVFLGGMSYSIYILQVPVFEWYAVLTSKLNIELSSELFFYSGLIILLFSSSISFYFLEIPVRKWLTGKM